MNSLVIQLIELTASITGVFCAKRNIEQKIRIKKTGIFLSKTIKQILKQLKKSNIQTFIEAETANAILNYRTIWQECKEFFQFSKYHFPECRLNRKLIEY